MVPFEWPGPMGPAWGPMGPPWNSHGTHGHPWGAHGAPSGPPWEPMGPPWAPLGSQEAPWGPHGASWGHHGASEGPHAHAKVHTQGPETISTNSRSTAIGRLLLVHPVYMECMCMRGGYCSMLCSPNRHRGIHGLCAK